MNAEIMEQIPRVLDSLRAGNSPERASPNVIANLIASVAGEPAASGGVTTADATRASRIDPPKMIETLSAKDHIP